MCEGKPYKITLASQEKAPTQEGGGRGGSAKTPKGVAKAATGSQPGSLRLDRPQEANALRGQSGKRQAESAGHHSADAGAKAFSKRARVSASAQKGPEVPVNATRAGRATSLNAT